MKKILRLDLILLGVIVVISIVITIPYFHPGYFPTHDGEWAVVRAAEMFREVRDHQFPPRYSGVLNFGYGYPLFNFVYPFPYYLATILHFLKFGFVDSIKVLFALSVPLSGIFMFFSSKKIWNNSLAAFTSSILYILYPYRIVDLYIRGSLGESIAFALAPLLLFLLLSLLETPHVVLLVLASVVTSLLIMTHNIMALYFIPLLFLLSFVFGILKNKKPITALVTVLLFGILLSSFFLFPALFEKQNIALSKIPIADRHLYFTNFSQLIFPKWGYGTPTDSDGFGYQIGIAQIFVVLFAIAFFIKNKLDKTKKKFEERLPLIILGLIIGMIFMMFEITALIWKFTPLLSEINYPWTLLGPLGFCISLLAGFLLLKLPYKIPTITVLTLLSFLLIFPFAHPKEYVNRGDEFYLTNEATTTSSDELMPLWVTQKPHKRFDEKVEVGQGRVSNLSYNSKSVEFSVLTFFDTTIKINSIYYPGWRVAINNKESIITYNNKNGVMEFPVKAGDNKIKATFTETPLRLFSDALSAITALLLITLLFFYKKINLSILRIK